MPLLKTHLQEEWDGLAERERAKLSNQNKRKRETEDIQGTEQDSIRQSKRQDQSRTSNDSAMETD